MQGKSRHPEVFQLRMVDPQTALSGLKKLFGITDDAKTVPPSAPQIEAELTTRKLIVNGTDEQIAQIRLWLEKMGESEVAAGETANPSKVRMLNIPPRSARTILEQMQSVWTIAHPNKIREVTPSAVIPSMAPGADETPSNIPQHFLERMRENAPKGNEPLKQAEPPRMFGPSQPATSPSATGSSGEQPQENRAAPQPSDEDANRTAALGGAKIRLVAEERQAMPPTAEVQPLAVSPEKEPKPAASAKANQPDPNAGAPIIISIGPGGVMIASDDTKALDEFERLFTSMASAAVNSSSNMTIFYLKHAKAAVVGEILDQILGGGTLQQSDGGGGGGGLLGDMMGAAMGEAGGGFFGQLLTGAGGGSIKPSGAIKITPDARLNALVVQANPTDIDTIEQLLKILDQPGSPEDVLISPKPQIIPLMNTDAEKMAEIVKSTFQNRLEATRGQGGQASPQDLLQMLRGGRRGGGSGGGRNQAEEIEKMTVTADTRTNSLIVAASDALFQDVKKLVETLDVTSADASEAIQVISVHNASPTAIESALQAIAGENVQFSRSGGGAAGMRPGGAQQAMPQFGQGFGGGGFNRGGGGGGFNRGGGNFGGGGNRGGAMGGGGGNRGGGNMGGGGGNRGGGNFGGGGGGGRGMGGGGGGRGNRGGGGGGGNRGG
jgi:hypothetical protein